MTTGCVAPQRSGGASGDACAVLNGGASSDDVRERSYGSDGRLTTEKLNGVVMASYAYSGNGQITSVTDAKSNTTSYQYDGYDRLLRTTYADQSYEYINRNGYGDVTSLRQRDAPSISYGQDLLGQITTISLPLADQTATYHWAMTCWVASPRHRTATVRPHGAIRLRWRTMPSVA